MKRLGTIVIALMVVSLMIGALACKGAKRKDVPRAKPADIQAQLAAGNERFIAQDARRKDLVAGQQPHAVVVACADSRVAPEIVLDQGLGDLFVVRVAGNVANAENIASIEYALEHLGSSLIVVMGHTSCGAVKAAVTYTPDDHGLTRDLVTLVENIRANITAGGGQLAASTDDPAYRNPAIANVRGVIKDLMAGSEVISRAVEGGKVKLVPALYSLETGKVEML